MWVSETALTNVVTGCLKVLETPTALKQTLIAIEIGRAPRSWPSTSKQRCNPSAQVLLVLLLVVSLVMVTVYAREGADGPLHAVQNAVASAVAPLKFVGTSAAAGADAAGESLGTPRPTSATLSGLRQRNAELTEQLAQDEELRQENERLRGLLDLKGTYDLDGVAARVVGRSSNAYSQTVTIDVGENDGVDTGLTGHGLHRRGGPGHRHHRLHGHRAPAHRSRKRRRARSSSRRAPKASCAAPWTACCTWKPSTPTWW